MSTLIKNGIPHPIFGSGEIIPTTSQLISDSGQDHRKDPLHSSEDSLDSCEEKNSLQQTSVSKKRTKLKVRSISDSTDEELVPSYFSYKSILKYGNNRLRSLSESCAENYSGSSNHGESNSALDDWCEEEELDEDGEEGESQKVKKTVRFSNVVHKQLFRSTSSILGQRKKNQRKARNKAKKHSNNAEHPPMSSSNESDHAIPCDDDAEINNAMEAATLSDSGIEVEDSDPGMVQQQGSNPTAKKNKKKNRVKTNRRRANSESSNNEMIFDLDL